MTAPSHAYAQPRLVWPDGPHAGDDVRYTIATLVTDSVQYDAMRSSFREGGFSGPDCEWIMIDNTGPTQTDAFRGLNGALATARGTYVILCHQDVRLIADDRANLDARLDELDRHDGLWAVAGNAGGVAPGVLALRITDPHGADQKVGPLPARVMSLDENFMVVKRASRIGFSADLEGFHFYGPDLVMHATMAGYSAYVIDFHLAHLSGGTKNAAFYEMQEAFRAKWSRALSPRWMQSTCALLRLSGAPLGQMAGWLAERPYAKLVRPKRPGRN